MFVRQHISISPNFISILLYLGFKRNKYKCNFHYVAMSVMRSQILKTEDFTKTHKSRYLENESFFLQLKKIQGLLYGKKYFNSGGNL